MSQKREKEECLPTQGALMPNHDGLYLGIGALNRPINRRRNGEEIITYHPSTPPPTAPSLALYFHIHHGVSIEQGGWQQLELEFYRSNTLFLLVLEEESLVQKETCSFMFCLSPEGLIHLFTLFPVYFEMLCYS